MLLDEPSEGIPPSVVQDIARIGTELDRRTGLTIVLVERNIEMICAMAPSGGMTGDEQDMSWFDNSIMTLKGEARGKPGRKHEHPTHTTVHVDLIKGWMATDFGFDEHEAYLLLTQCGKLRIGNMVAPKYTLGASITRRIAGNPASAA